MTRILIGYNGSDAATAALYDLCRAGFPEETQAVVLTVAESLLHTMSVSKATSIAMAGKSALGREFPTWTVKAETASGGPAREILARSESFDPDVIVIGEPRQMFPTGTICFGHTSQTILAEAGCSVRIARGTGRINPQPARLLVGFDGSAGSIHAVDVIARRKWPEGTKATLLAVADSSVLGSIGRFIPQMNNAVLEAKIATQWAETLAADSIGKLKRAGLIATLEVQLGHARETIIKVADASDTDCIFVGPHCSVNCFERFLSGSVSASVAASANCSVEVSRTSTDPSIL